METTASRRCVRRCLERDTCRRTCGALHFILHSCGHIHIHQLFCLLCFICTSICLSPWPTSFLLVYLFVVSSSFWSGHCLSFLISLPCPTSTAFLLIARLTQDRHLNCATVLLKLNRKACDTCSGNYSWNSGCGVFPQHVQRVPLSPGWTCLNMQAEDKRRLKIKSTGRMVYDCSCLGPSLSKVTSLLLHGL